jgi:hypothetical protein
MKALTCGAARRRLDAYHDEELSLSDQIAVSSHLEWCDDCAAALDDLRQVRDLLRKSMPGRIALSNLSAEDDLNLQATVIDRLKAEERLSFAVWVQDAFTDMHFVYAGLSAVAAALACVAITLSMMRVAFNELPDSTAAMVRTFGTPGSNLNPVSVSPRLRMPRALDEPVWVTPVVVDDTYFTLSAVVTREGRVGNLEVLNSNGGRWIPTDRNEAKAVEDLIGVVSRARFEPASMVLEPASMAGLPVAVNMVWIVAHTTVRATQDPLALRAIRAARKRTA